MALKIKTTVQESPNENPFPMVYAAQNGYEGLQVLFFKRKSGVAVRASNNIGEAATYPVGHFCDDWMNCDNEYHWIPRPDIKVSFE
jgi:hypothetical protein